MTIDAGFSPNASPIPATKRRVDLDGPDFYPTPPWATRALLAVEDLHGSTLEPACGGGHMARVLIDYYAARDPTSLMDVTTTDLYGHGVGIPGDDFTECREPFANVVTNPPYNSAEGFITAGLRCATSKLCLLMRLSFLEGAGRGERVFRDNPPSRVWVFSERPTFYPIEEIKRRWGEHEMERFAASAASGEQYSMLTPNGEPPDWFLDTLTGGTTAYAWYVWDRAHVGPTELRWLPVGLKPRVSRGNRWAPHGDDRVRPGHT